MWFFSFARSVLLLCQLVCTMLTRVLVLQRRLLTTEQTLANMLARRPGEKGRSRFHAPFLRVASRCICFRSDAGGAIGDTLKAAGDKLKGASK